MKLGNVKIIGQGFLLKGKPSINISPVTITNQIELVITAILGWEKRSPHHVQMFHVENTNHVIHLEISRLRTYFIHKCFQVDGTSRSNFNVPFYGHYLSFSLVLKKETQCEESIFEGQILTIL